MRRLSSSITGLSALSALAIAGLVLGCSGGVEKVDPGPGPGTETGGETSGDDTGTSGETAPLPDTGAAGDGTTDSGGPLFETDPEDTDPDSGGGDTGGVIPGCGLDSDGDGIADSIEGKDKKIDTDGDGTPDYLDLDSDNDGIPDAVEWLDKGCVVTERNDADGDGIPNFRDEDSDDNGLPDKNEACPPVGMPGAPADCSLEKPSDFDGDGTPDFADIDNDHDSSKADKTLGLIDKVELSDASGKFVGLIDSDKDGIPDVYDRDSDNDGILDLDDGTDDSDGDGEPNFRDLDSDGDTVPDACEARGKATFTESDYDLPLADTNKNGTPDFLERDSDGDLLADGKEDKNGNCIVDADETDRTKADTDGDGVSDLVEVTLLGVAAAKDPTKDPVKSGKFYFLEPYSADGSLAPSPTTSTLALSTTLNKGDVAFSVDTTGSMSGTIAGLKASLSTTIIPELKKRIPDLGIAVTGHDDFPYSGFGSAGDKPFYLNASGFVTTDTATAQAQANALRLGNGNDGPESQVPAMYHILANSGLTWPGGSVPAAAALAGTFGGVRFRSDALPIVINATDISMHNGKTALSATTYDTSFQFPYSFSTYNVDQLVAKFNELGAKFIGLAADGGARSTSAYAPYGHLAYIADKTGSVVPPTAFGPGSSCKTGVSGGPVAPDAAGGQCRLVFSFNSSGTGIGTSVVDGVVAMLNTIKFDVYVTAASAAGSTIDVPITFMSKVEPNPAGGTDPITGGTCVTFDAANRRDWFVGPKNLGSPAKPGPLDGAFDTITGLNPGKLHCFTVVPRPNTTIKSTTEPQLFRATLKVLALRATGGTFTLGTDREVLFIVPPALN